MTSCVFAMDDEDGSLKSFPGEIYPQITQGLPSRDLLSVMEAVPLARPNLLRKLAEDVHQFNLDNVEEQRAFIRYLNFAKHESVTIKLELSNVTDNTLNSLKPYMGCIRTLNLSHHSNKNIQDISALAGAYNLQYLNLRNTHVADVSCLANLYGLTALELSYTYVTNNSLATLANLHNLEKLGLQNTHANDASIMNLLRNCQNMKCLYLRNTDITNASIGVIATLHNLEQLDLGYTNIGDVTLLTGLYNLKKLNLQGAHIRNVHNVSEFRARFSKLEDLYIGDIKKVCGAMSG